MSILCYMSAVTTLLVGYNCLTGFSNPDKHLETSPNLLAVILLAGSEYQSWLSDFKSIACSNYTAFSWDKCEVPGLLVFH